MIYQPKWASRDSQYATESLKYSQPAPSREFILSILDESARPITLDELAVNIGLESEAEIDGLRRRLIAMLRDGQLIENRRGQYGRVERMDLIQGRVTAHADGFGFLVPDDHGEDVFLPPKEMSQLFHGDRALVRVRRIDQRGRREGFVVEVLERLTKQLVGRFYQESGMGFVTPDNPRITHNIVIPPDHWGNAKEGQIVVVDVIEPPGKHHQAIGHLREVLGDHMAPGMEIDVAVRNHGIPHTWPEAVEIEAGTFPSEVFGWSVDEREDLRSIPLVTVDGEDARDFDDAIFCEPSGSGWRLLVAIADVSHYVQVDTALDREAKDRGNSVYFPERVVPMLPEALSNGLCSLNPKVDRLCMVCALEISKNGEIERFQFFEGVMCSAARLTYNEFQRAVVDKDSAARHRVGNVLPHLENLHKLYQVMREARTRRGSIDFDLPEVRIRFDEHRKIQEVYTLDRFDAHRVIEECMIAANVASASFLRQRGMPVLCRVHQTPAAERLEELREFLVEFGLGLAGGSEPRPADYGAVLAQVADRPERALIETVLLRSLPRALYTADPDAGHFGLALEAYAHFTSPIRRYPDLLVHRSIRHVLRGGQPENFAYTREEIDRMGAHCSSTERRADDAVHDVIAWLKCEFLMDRLGETFNGRISGVTPFGLFVTIDGVQADGLIHVTALDSDYYHFDPIGRRLRGERSGRVYRLGDAISVRLARIDLDERKIDFEPVRDLKEKKSDSKTTTKTPAKGAVKSSGKLSAKPVADKPLKKSETKSKAKRGGRRRSKKSEQNKIKNTAD